jgi:Kef-type K+ transport system membrane component KefB
VAIAAILLMPSLSRRLKLPGVVGVLFSGIILGPHVQCGPHSFGLPISRYQQPTRRHRYSYGTVVVPPNQKLPSSDDENRGLPKLRPK